MKIKDLVRSWFEKWETGDILKLPISDSFTHTSPFGTIRGKKEYLALVEENREKFLNHRFEIQDGLYEQDKACVRYTAIQGEFSLDVSEWYYIKSGQIDQIVSYYHIGEIREDRKLSGQD